MTGHHNCRASLGLDVDTFIRQCLETIAEKRGMKKGEGEFTVHPPKRPRR